MEIDTPAFIHGVMSAMVLQKNTETHPICMMKYGRFEYVVAILLCVKQGHYSSTRMVKGGLYRTIKKVIVIMQLIGQV